MSGPWPRLRPRGLPSRWCPADAKFTSAWRSSEAGTVSFAGKKLAALVISQDDSLRVPGEEALVRELTARGLQSVATYRIAPKEELQSADRAEELVREGQCRGGRGAAAGEQGHADDLQRRHVDQSQLQHLLGLLRLQLEPRPTSPASIDRDTIVVVETTIYSVPRNQLLWAAVSETKNPSTLPRFVRISSSSPSRSSTSRAWPAASRSRRPAPCDDLRDS